MPKCASHKANIGNRVACDRQMVYKFSYSPHEQFTLADNGRKCFPLFQCYLGGEGRTRVWESCKVVSNPAFRTWKLPQLYISVFWSGGLTFCFPLVVIFAGRLIRLSYVGASQVALVVKNPPAMQEPQEIWIRSLGQEDLLEEGMATLSSILAWRIPWTDEPNGLWSLGSQRVRHDWRDLARRKRTQLCQVIKEVRIRRDLSMD